MGKHWEWAVPHASGEYVGILTDRMVFKRNALGKIQAVIKEHRPTLISYIWDTVPSDRPPYQYSQRRYSNNVFLYSSAGLIDASAQAIFPHLLPRGLNTFWKSTLIKDIGETYGKIFNSIAPDYFFCYILLDHLDNFHYFDSTLSISWGEDVSTGSSFKRGRVTKPTRDMISFMKQQNNLSYAPIIVNSAAFVSIPYNGILREYNFVSSQQKSGRFKPIVKESFYLRAFQKIRDVEGLFRVEMKDSKELLELYRQKNDLSLPANMNDFHKSKDIIKRVIKWLARPIAFPIAKKLGLEFRSYDLKALPKGAFKSIEEILMFEEDNQRKPAKKYRPPEKILEGVYKKCR
jgi:hypothetical protein